MLCRTGLPVSARWPLVGGERESGGCWWSGKGPEMVRVVFELRISSEPRMVAEDR
jgi:hypothetical protein